MVQHWGRARNTSEYAAPKGIGAEYEKIHPAVRCLFILPAVLWFFAAVIVPVLMAVYYSFFSWDGVTAKVFIRFDNYRELFKDPVVWKSLTNSLKMAFWCVLLQLPIGMAFSVIL